jgi:transcriptional regulator with XRE-family HTH domain
MASDFQWLSTALRARRTELEISRAELAERIGVSEQLVREVEDGGTERRLGYVLAIATALDMDPQTLFETRVRPEDAHEDVAVSLADKSN